MGLLPDTTDTASGQGPWGDSGALLHEATNWEPQAVAE